MPDKGDILDNTEATLEDFLYNLEDLVKKTIGIVEPLPERVNNLISDIAALKLIEAAKQIPGAVGDVAGKSGEALGQAGETAAAGISTVPGVATDVLEDVQSISGTTSRGGSSLLKTKLRRRR